MFVAEGHDQVKRQTFYRPMGGSIEFGETAAQCLRREFKEEAEAKVDVLRPLGTLENIFTYLGKPGHEIVLVFECRFTDERFYKIESVACSEQPAGHGPGGSFTALWKPISDFHPRRAPLFPVGLLDLMGEKMPSRTTPAAGS